MIRPSFRPLVDGTAVLTAVRRRDGMLLRLATQGRDGTVIRPRMTLDVDIVAAAEEAGEIGAGGIPAAPCLPDGSSPAARTPQNSAPYAKHRRRSLMACTTCRKRKIRCITTEQPPINPCTRCTKNGLPCEYMAVGPDDSTPSQSPNLVPSALPYAGGHSRHPSIQAPAHPSSAASSDLSRGAGMALPLPYTGPPPVHGRPRYSATQYPDLSFSGSGSSHSTP
ncbi:hypothetical protein B0H14DRAFT_3443038 [Mycena olivaceomarginata]|nr:hypothetical protein B0H14DRAFT_3443038 [Mycena olivaceomarginata]